MKTPAHVVRPRPRIAVIGLPLDDNETDRLRDLAATFYFSESPEQLSMQVSENEVDILITIFSSLAKPVALKYFKSCHSIVFSVIDPQLPRFTISDHHRIALSLVPSEAIEYVVSPSSPEPLLRCIERWASTATSAKGLLCITQYEEVRMTSAAFVEALMAPQAPQTQTSAYLDAIKAGAVITPAHGQGALVTLFERPTGVRAALLPGVSAGYFEWVKAILALWKSELPDVFPELEDWTSSPQWMSGGEAKVRDDLSALAQHKSAFLRQMAADEVELEAKMQEARQAAKFGVRRLLTAQGDELKSAVLDALTDLGFEVQDMDRDIPPGRPKKEDLRIRFEDWEALVEVKGYAKGGGKTSDLQGLQRFLRFYEQEKGRLPDRIYYIVNIKFEQGQPAHRGKILEGAEEDLATFVEDNGVAIATRELFILHRERHRLGLDQARRLLMDAKGRFDLPHGR